MAHSGSDLTDHSSRTCRPLPAWGAGPRIVHFPEDRSLGTLALRGPSRGSGMVTTSPRVWHADWRGVGPASGRVVVPAHNQLQLTVAPDAPGWALRLLAPDALQALSIRGEAAWEAVVPSLAERTGLVALEVWAVPVGDDDLAPIARLRGLRSLGLWGTLVGAGGVARLRRLPALRRLTLPAGVGDEALAAAAGLPGLAELEVPGSRVTDLGLEALRGSGLARLNLWGTKVTDAGLDHLRTMPGLRELDLGSTAVTDGGLACLASLPLRSLSLLDTLVTPAGLRCLRSVMGDALDPGDGSDHCPGWRPPARLRRTAFSRA